MVPDHRLTDCACFNAHRAARLLGQLYDRALKPSGLTNTQYSLLATAGTRGSTRLTKLAHDLGMDRTTLTRNLRLLEQRELVTVQPGRDARSRVVSLSPAGGQALAAATPLWQEAQARVIQAMGRSQWPLFLSQIRVMNRRGEDLLAVQKEGTP